MDGIFHKELGDYDYDLPQERIAQYPLEVREDSRLLIYNETGISDDRFRNLSEHLERGSLLVINETRVVHARMLFRKETGAEIEIFCLEPVSPVRELHSAFSQNSGIVWKCLVGNSRKWKSGKLYKSFTVHGKKITIAAWRTERATDHSLIRFEWEPQDLTFSDILEITGRIPLPPYVTRTAEEQDKIRYQTVYAAHQGSVAAPTAGLHFTGELLKTLKAKGIKKTEITLHVGAGTFRPLSSGNLMEHNMHLEQVSVSLRSIERIVRQIAKGCPVVSVGTTTMRTLESLYWHGVALLRGRADPFRLRIGQWDPYNNGDTEGISATEALEAIIEAEKPDENRSVRGETRLMIVPGYQFRVADTLITNFHMPRSTLLLLIAAFVGDDWKDIYDYALRNDFRFLSFGDACLLFHPKYSNQ